MKKNQSAPRVTIDQTLHGYSQGHRLLAASKPLPSQAQRTVLELSDLSGDLVTGFEEYLTGYPVPATNYFAFAKTWYAPEMERPGCVWTHTLLISIKDFEVLINPHVLQSLFRRPSKSDSTSSYETALAYVIPRDTNKQFIMPKADDEDSVAELYSRLFTHLYEESGRVVILAQDSLRYETLVLSAWAQQWPSLRAAFTFCTGALETRTISKRTFDLQVGPRQNRSFFVRSSEVTILDPQAGETIDLEPLTSTYRRFFQKYDPQKRFIWHYGTQIDSEKSNFGWLARCFDLVEQARHKPALISKVTEHLAERFAGPDQMRELKADLYGGTRTNNVVTKALADDKTLLEHLLKTEHNEMFDLKDLRISSRTSALSSISPRAAVDIAFGYKRSKSLTAIQHEYLFTLAHAVSPSDLFKFAKRKRPFLIKLWALNPNLMTAEEIWQPSERAAEWAIKVLIEKCKTGESESIDWEKIVAGMLLVRNPTWLLELEDLVGNKLVEYVLNAHAATTTAPTIDEGWYAFLQQHLELAISWSLATRNALLTKALIASMTTPDKAVVYGSSPWLELTEDSSERIPQPFRTKVMAFLLAVGFLNPDDESYRLVEASFQTVHDAAASNCLPHKAWSYLESLAPSRHFLFEWDKCRRLEEALISNVVRFQWPQLLIVWAAKNEGTLWNLLYRLSGAFGGKTILRAIENAYRTGELVVDSQRAEVLDSFFRRD